MFRWIKQGSSMESCDPSPKVGGDLTDDDYEIGLGLRVGVAAYTIIPT